MKFVQIPDNTTVFLDSNVLIYHFTAHPIFGPECQWLIDHITKGFTSGATSAHVLSEVAHRIMAIEAMDQFGWPEKGIAYRLQKHPDEVKTLMRCRQVIDEIPRLGIEVLPVTHNLVVLAGAISNQTGLLSGDALVVG
jgi:predicted nucleic acid-binding protein